MQPAQTLAVLPFVNRSSDAENEYFSDGITEEIINALAKVDSLKVISRTSSFFFKSKSLSLKEIAQELNAQIIVEGSVRVANEQVRITAQLIQTEEDVQVWSETWDRKLENIFEIQDEISLLIADKLREQVGHFEISESLIGKQTSSLNAYQLSLKAKYHLNRWNPEDVKIAIGLYEKAIAIDPSHTESQVGLADSYSFMGTTGFMDGETAWKKSVEHTHTALALDSSHPGVHYLLANISFFLECDYSAAFKHAMQSVRLKANYPEGQQYLSFLYTLKGEMNLAEKHLQLALALDPLNQETLFYKAFFLYRQNNISAAKTVLESLMQLNPRNIPAFTVVAYCLLMQKEGTAVLQLLNNLPNEVIIPDEELGLTCLAYIVENNTEQVNKWLPKLELRAQEPMAFQAHSYLFLAYAQLQQLDDAFDWLQQSLKNNSPIFLIAFSDPLTRPLAEDKRYAEFHHQIYPEVISEEAKEPKKAPIMDDASCLAFTKRLLNYVEQESPFLNPEISLRLLAKCIEIHPNQLSWLLNTQLNKNFNEFINQYRIAHFKKLATDSSNQHISIMGLAYESGFQSKTVFNTFFKKETGQTPSAFMKSQKV